MALKALLLGMKYLFKRPYTMLVPEKEPPMTTEKTRGRHLLDMSKCVGCRMCQMVCPADAIKMYKVEGDFKRNPKKIFPGIDFNRCTFCALCVEVCPTGALSMTDITGWYMTTTDTRTNLRSPYDLAAELAKNEKPDFRVTITKQTFLYQTKKKKG